MKVRTIKNWIILVLLTTYVILYKLFIFENYMKYSEFISVSFLGILLALCVIFLGFRKDRTTILGKNIFKVVIFYIVLAFFVMYGIGLIVGFLKNAYSRSLMSIFDNTFAPILIILLIEFIRYVFISANKDKKATITIFSIALIAFELFTTIRVFDLSDLAVTFNVVATVILPCIFKNILLSYLTYHVGYKIPIIYRLIMDVYLFVVPIIPSLGDYMNSMILISLPILIYISVCGIVDDAQNRAEPVFNKKRFTVWDIPVAIILITLIALISGFFPHYMIGIGSDSMKPVISKGDAVILEKVNDKTKLKKGDIIAYNNGRLIIVHRIHDITGSGKKTTYILKGDANNGTDPRAVPKNQIQGVVKLRIPYIAWPTVWLTELFNR